MRHPIQRLRASRRRVALASLTVLLVCTATFAQSPLVARLEARLVEHPQELHLYYYSALLEARQRNWGGVTAALDMLLEAGWDAGVDPSQFADPPLEVGRRLSALQERVLKGVNSRLTLRIPERHLIPEGIAFDAQRNSFLLGSIQQAKVVRVSRVGVVSDLVAVGTSGQQEVLGIKADSRRRVLWVVSVSRSDGASAILRVNLDTGHVLSRHELKVAGETFELNDLCLDEDRAFATETLGGRIYEIRSEYSVPRPVTDIGRLLYPNGIACQQGVVWVSDAFSLHALDVRTMEFREIRGHPLLTGAGIDGLVATDSRLIGIQNAFGAGRIIELTVDPGRTRISAARVLEGWRPEFGVPTTGVVIGREFHYIANSQFHLRASDGSMTSSDALRDVLILNLPLAVTPRRTR